MKVNGILMMLYSDPFDWLMQEEISFLFDYSSEKKKNVNHFDFFFLILSTLTFLSDEDEKNKKKKSTTRKLMINITNNQLGSNLQLFGQK
jgi:hypothetical protein